jgi:hypothetical protein
MAVDWAAAQTKSVPDVIAPVSCIDSAE